MKVLVIGGAGYIGSHVVKELMKNGHQVTVFDNMSSGLECNLFKENGFIKGDIRNYKDINKAFSYDFDAFIHLAALKAPGVSMEQPEKFSENNINGTLNVLNAAIANNCKKMIFSSSAAIFGEPQYLPIDEEHPKNPINYYGFTKLEIERFMDWYDKLKGLRFAALRYFNAAGYDTDGDIKGLEVNPDNLIPRIMEYAQGKAKFAIFGTDYDTKDGTCVRDYIHVTDLARAHVKALEYIDKNDKSIKINLGTSNGTTVKEICDSVCKCLNKKLEFKTTERRNGDPAKLLASYKKAKELLNWEPKYSDIDTIISSTAKVYGLI